jgi:chromosome partitioning protein
MFEHCVLVLNGKGGVLKTSLTAQLAGLAAFNGWKVLAVDLDQQGNLARDLGYTDKSDNGANLYDAVVRSSTLTPLKDVRPELDVVPGGVHHLRLYREVSNPPGNMVPTYDEIRRVLAPIAPRYDLIVIDAPPGGEAIHLSALSAARWVLIPTQPDQASIDGLSTVFRTLSSVRDSTNPSVEVLGVVLGPMASNASRLRSDAVARLNEVVGDKVHIFDRTIRSSQVAAVQCRELGLLVHEYEDAALNATPWYKLSKEERKNRRNFSDAAPGLAEDYRVLVDEIMRRITEGLIETEREELRSSPASEHANHRR